MSACPSNFLTRIFRWTHGFLGFVIIAGCTSDIEKQNNLDSGNLLIVALENLTDRYIEPLQPGAMSINGLKKLIAVDPTLNIDRQETHITLSMDGTTLARHNLPDDSDIHEWADLTVQLMNRARSLSPTLARLSENETHKLLLSGIIENTDKYSRYLPPKPRAAAEKHAMDLAA